MDPDVQAPAADLAAFFRDAVRSLSALEATLTTFKDRQAQLIQDSERELRGIHDQGLEDLARMREEVALRTREAVDDARSLAGEELRSALDAVVAEAGSRYQSELARVENDLAEMLEARVSSYRAATTEAVAELSQRVAHRMAAMDATIARLRTVALVLLLAAIVLIVK